METQLLKLTGFIFSLPYSLGKPIEWKHLANYGLLRRIGLVSLLARETN